MKIDRMYLYTFYEDNNNDPFRIVAKNIEEAAKVFRTMFNAKNDVIKVENNGEVNMLIDKDKD